MKKRILFLQLLLASMISLYGQKIGINEILYGSSYYHEYMPYERLEKDMQMMQDAGLNVIRCGESTWGLFEPEEGKFDFTWFDRVLDAAHKHGIKVIVGTPTYAIPQWMGKKYPEVLVQSFQNNRTQFGGRQNMDITNPTYLYFAERIIRKLVTHVRNHPAVIGFQVDNETSAYGTAGENVKKKFLAYLEKKFVTPDSLNKAWTLNYWSHNIAKWEDFNVAVYANNAYWLEWNRFQRKLAADFLGWEASIVRELRRPDQFITQNFDLSWHNDESNGPQPYVDQYGASKYLDMAGIDIYHKVQDNQDGSVIAFGGDYTRSFKNTNYLVLETQAQAKGGIAIDQQVPYDGQLRQSVYSHLACGANMVSYWPWHSIHNANETFWKGVLSHDLEPNREYYEVQRTALELKKIGNHLVNLQKKNKVAILYSQDALNGLLMKPFSRKLDYGDIIFQLHKALFKLNVEADFITPDKPRFSDYKVIIVPPLYVTSDSLLNALNTYIKNGGNAVICFKSGFCNMNSAVRPIVMPGILREACGISYQEFCNIDKLSFNENPFGLSEKENYGTEWVELIKPEKAKVLLTYKHSFYSKYPAVTDNTYGKGRVIYQGTVLSDSVQTKLFEKLFTESGLLDKNAIKFPVIIRNGINQNDKNIHYLFNYTAENKTIPCPFIGNELLSSKVVNKGDMVQIEPWGVLIIEEK